MQSGTHEQTINTAVAEVLADLCKGWKVRAENIGKVFLDGGRPDILIEEPAGWPIVIEAEVANHRQAEIEAKSRLGKRLAHSPRSVESTVALVYREDLRQYNGRGLRDAIRASEFEYIVLGSVSEDGHGRFPPSGWLSGGIRELAMLVRRISVPIVRVEALAIELENGVNSAVGVLSNHPIGGPFGTHIAAVLDQRDDEMGQSRKMAMTVITNALVFHAALAEAEMSVEDIKTKRRRSVNSPTHCRKHGAFQPTQLLDEWAAILKVNYWPIFHTGGSILKELPTQSAVAVLDTLWETAEALIAGGVTKSHDLTGIVFQRLIADRKFLATFYTRPAAAVLLAGLALPPHHTMGSKGWEDVEAMHALRIGDFACGTGTLLSSAYQRISLMNELYGGDPKELHRHMMKNGLVGLDVLNVAVHLTAAMLAGSHPDTPFDGECLLSMPYGKHSWGYSLGSLDLLSAQVPFPFIEAAAKTAGGRGQEEVRELIQRVAHGHFQLVIMNPPFTRHGAREGDRSEVHNPAFAAFDADEEEQNELAKHLKQVAGKDTHAHGHAGLASHFVELAHRKIAPSGKMALVLPMSAMIGQAWQACRSLWFNNYRDIVVVSIAEGGTQSTSFSADTGMAECLFIATKSNPGISERRAFSAVLRGRPQTALEGDLIAQAISKAIVNGQVRKVEDGPYGDTRIELGDTLIGEIVDCPLPETGSWPMVSVSDMTLGQTAYQLANGRLWIEGMRSEETPTIPIAPIGEICKSIGPHDLDISGAAIKTDGLPQGPFEIIPGVPSGAAYPSLWNHDAKKERHLTVLPDTHGQVREVSGRIPLELQNRAATRWATATRAHYNRDLRFNSQSLVVAMTDMPCIRGRAWPSVIIEEPDYEYAFALWCNSTLGLICHWWSSNHTQSGRGTTTITGIPLISTLHLASLSSEQHKTAKTVFEKLTDARLLSFDQIDEDPSRAQLDRFLLVDVLGLHPRLCEPNGPLVILRQKLAAEPQINGGKKTRVVFTAEGEDNVDRDDR